MFPWTQLFFGVSSRVCLWGVLIGTSIAGLSASPATAQSPGEIAAAQARAAAEEAGRRAAAGGQMSSDEEMEMGMEDDGYGDDYGYEDEYDDGYGSSNYGGYGGGRGSSPELMLTYAPGILSLFDSMDLRPILSPDADVTIQTGPVLRRESQQAFEAGNHAMAIELMCGHMTTEYDEAQPIIGAVKFSTHLRRPAWSLRWATSIAVRMSDGAVEAQPIREGTTTPGRRMASAGGYGDDYGGGYEGMEEDYAQQMAMDDYDYEEMEQGMDGRMGRPPKDAKPAIKQRDMLSSEADETLDKNLGLVAEVVAEEFGKRFSSGDWGPLFVDITPPEPADPRASVSRAPVRGAPGEQSVVKPPMSPELDVALSEAPEPIPMWRAGIVFLGEGDSKEMVQTAKAEGIDFLLHFDVLVKKSGRNEAVQNISRCRLFSVDAGKQLAVSKGIDSLEAAQLVSTGRAAGERDYVKDQLANLIGIIDRDTKMIPMPTSISDEAARRRVATLISGADAKTLQTLAEIRLYQSQGLLTLPEVETAFDIVGGPEALLFMHGPREQRMAMARKWAIKSQAVATK